jgi:hypothetical protein
MSVLILGRVGKAEVLEVSGTVEAAEVGTGTAEVVGVGTVEAAAGTVEVLFEEPEPDLSGFQTG